MLHYVSNNSFTLLVSKDTKSTCTVMSLSSGRIYRSTTKQIFDSKKGEVVKLRNRRSKIEVEKSIYGMIKEKKYLGKGVSERTYNQLFKHLKAIDSYAKS